MLDSYRDVLTIEDITAILRISRRSVMRLLYEGKIEYRKIGRIYRVSKKAVENYLYPEQEPNNL